MTNPPPPTTPAGWYPDPAGSPRSRWWDGAQWTEQYYDPATASPAQNLRAPEGIAVYTPWVWIIVFLPLLSLVGLFSVDFASSFTSPDYTPGNSFGALSSPGYAILNALGFVIYGLCVLFAFLDWRKLGALAVPRPFHWAWAFLSSAVYVIGRSVVVRRRTGRGIAPMWVQIAVIVVGFFAAIVWVVSFFSAMFNAIQSYPYL